MIQLSYNRLLILLFIVLSIGVLPSCKKNNDDANTSQVQLLSFGPTGARHGDTLRFIGIHLDRVTAIHFTGTNAIINQNAFKQQSSDLILVIVPTTAEKGYITLKTPTGDIITKTILNLNVKTSASISSITKQARPGDNITIAGNYLNWVKRITFGKNKVVTSFVSQSQSQLVVQVPTDAQTGTLLVGFSGTDTVDVQTADTLQVMLPVATTLSPNPIKHQTNLTITGTNLDLAKQILFNGVSAAVTTFVSQSATQIVVKVPGATVKGKVSLVAASGVVTQSVQDLDISMPTITSIAPNPIDPGTNLTITGTNLDLVSGISFTGGTAPITVFVSQSPTQIVVKVPIGTLKGKITLGVINSTLTVESTQVLDLNGGLPPLANFTMPIYTDALQNGFQDWSFTDTHDFNSTAVVRQGTTSIRAVYGGNTYQGITFHAGTGISTTGYTSLEFSVFVDASLNGKKIQVVTNGNYSGPAPQVTLVGGAWSTFTVSLSSMGSPATISEIVLQSAGFAGTVHIDHVGLR
jgi:hypothetical protein